MIILPDFNLDKDNTRESILNYVDERLQIWAKWAREGTGNGLGYHTQCILSRLIEVGIIERTKRRSKQPISSNPPAEEVEELLKDMSAQDRFMADVLREMYLTQDRIENKSRRMGCTDTVFKNRLAMGRWWLASRLTLQPVLKNRLKKLLDAKTY